MRAPRQVVRVVVLEVLQSPKSLRFESAEQNGKPTLQSAGWVFLYQPLHRHLMNLRELPQKVQSLTSQVWQRSSLLVGNISSFKIPTLKKTKERPEALMRSAVACHLGSSKILMLETEKSEKGLKLVRFREASEFGEHGKPSDMLKQLLQSGGFQASRVRVSVKGQGVVIRFVQFPQMKPADLRSAVSFEVEKYIPFKASEVVVDFHILDPVARLASGSGMDLLLVAVKRDEIQAVLQTFQEASLGVELIDVDALAAINALEFFYPDALKSSVAILLIGMDISTLCVVREGKPRFIRDISYAVVDIVKLLKRKLGLTDAAARHLLDGAQPAPPEAIEVIKQGYGNLVSDLKVSIDYYLDQAQNGQPLQMLFVEGTGSYYSLLSEIIAASLGITVHPFDLTSKVELGEGVDAGLVKKNSDILPVAMGLCLREL